MKTLTSDKKPYTATVYGEKVLSILVWRRLGYKDKKAILVYEKVNEDV
jgi:hypothetical protein